MKKKLIAGIFFVQIISAQAQSELFGKWTATCPAEFMDKVTIRHCTLCPVLNDSLGHSISVKDLDVSIETNFIIISTTNKSSKIPYVWDSQLHIITFPYVGTIYRFKTLPADNDFVLRNDDDTIVLLRRKKQ